MSSVPSRGIDSHRPFPILAVWLGLLAISCGPPLIRQRPLPRAGTSPAERPEVVLLVDGQPVLGNQPDGLEFDGLLVAAGFQSIRPAADEREEEGIPFWVLQFRAIDGETDYRLGLGMEEKLVPKLKRSAFFHVRFGVQHRGMFLPPALAVSILDETGRLLYLLDVDGAAGAAELPKGLSVDRSNRSAFTTALTMASGCALTLTHHFLEVEAGSRSASLAPGEERFFRAEDGTYRVVSLDISTSRDDVECVSEHPTYSAFVVERTADEAP